MKREKEKLDCISPGTGLIQPSSRRTSVLEKAVSRNCIGDQCSSPCASERSGDVGTGDGEGGGGEDYKLGGTPSSSYRTSI